MQQHQANSWQRSFNLLPVRSARWKIPEVRTAGLAWTSTSERWGLTLPTGAFPGVLPLFTFASSRRPKHWMCPILRSKTPVYSIFGTKQDRRVFDGLLPWKPVLPRLWCSQDAFSSSPQAVGNGHTGLVEQIAGVRLATIEGNTDLGGSREGIGVFRRTGRTIATINR